MIITLSDADFSAKNVGKIEVPRELSDFTKSAILASGNDSMSDSQKFALDSFFIAIGATSNTGIFAKTDVLILPMICNNIAKSFVNYKDNSVIGEPSSGDFKLQARGVKAINNVAVPAYSTTRPLKNSTMMLYNTELYTDLTTGDRVGICKKCGAIQGGFRTSTVSTQAYLADRTMLSSSVYKSVAPTTATYASFKGAIIKTFSDSQLKGMYDGETKTVDLSETEAESYAGVAGTGTIHFGTNVAWTPLANSLAPAFGAGSWGGELTDAEALAYTNALNALYRAFSV